MNNQKIEEIMQSLDGTRPATAPDFFYTRLSAKMLKQHDEPRTWYAKPAFAFAAFCLFLLLNIAVVMQRSNEENKSITNADNDSLQTIAADYSFDDANYQFDYALEK